MPRTPFNPLSITAGVAVVIAAIPLFFVAYHSAQLSATQWLGLWSQRLPELMSNTLILAASVTVSCFILGVSMAWIVTRRQFAGRGLLVWLMILPLTIPSYVYANIYTTLFSEVGWLADAWHALLGPTLPLPDLYNLFGVTLVLSLGGFSYVFLLTRAGFQNLSRDVEEAARSQGANARQVLWRISLPLLRPAIAAGLAVVVLHVLADFGAVSMLRYQTFTLAIYTQMSGRFDYEAAAALSLVLVLLSLTFLTIERFFRSQQRYYSRPQARPPRIKPATQRELLLIWTWAGLIAFFAFILPVAWLSYWSVHTWQLGLIGSEFWSYFTNSLIAALLAATAAMIVALPVGLQAVRRPGWASQTMVQLSNVGFVLPGPVIALGIITFVIATMPAIYGGLIALVLALVIRFLPLAVQSEEATLQQLTPSIEQAGRVHGAGPWQNLWQVTLPMIRGGMISAWVLVFIDTLKELPATLILRPVGFDTLPVRIWIEANEERLELAAPAAILLIVASLPALGLMMKGMRK